MPARRSAPRRRRARKPRARRAKLYKSMRGGALKHYTYNFKLLPQFLTNTGLGVVDIVAAAGGTGNLPILPLAASTPGVVNQGTSSPLGVNYIDVGLGARHSLSDITNFGAFQTMYDAYKINYVVAEIEYLCNVVTPGGQNVMPTVYTYWDQDDALPPTTTSNIAGKMGSRVFHPTASRTRFRMKYRPMVRDTVNTGNLAANVSNAGVARSMWLNSTDPDVAHFAFKAWITDYYMQLPTAGHNSFRINWTYNVSFRGPLITT